jgi:hypothetical protein
MRFNEGLKGIRVGYVRKNKRETIINCGVSIQNQSISWLELQLNKALGIKKERKQNDRNNNK